MLRPPLELLLRLAVCGLMLLVLPGCRTTSVTEREFLPAPSDLPAHADHPAHPAQAPPAKTELQPAAGTELGESAVLNLHDLTQIALRNNPRLRQADWAIEAARGLALQAGLRPNPTLSIAADELADRTGPVGVWNAPFFTQEIVTFNKLGLSQAAANQSIEIAQATLIAERMKLMAEVREAYWDLIARETQVAVLKDLVRGMREAVDTVKKLRDAGEATDLAVSQLELNLEKDLVELAALERSIPAARQRLAAVVGIEVLPAVSGNLDQPTPEYSLEAVMAHAVQVSPELRAARAAVQRAQLELARAEAEPKPNITLGAGYTYQGQNRSNDVSVAASLPLPCWNKNQGNIQAARARLAAAQAEVETIRNNLLACIATAFTDYSQAQATSAKYQQLIIPRAEQVFRLTFQARDLGQLEYLALLEAQRTLANARHELVRSLADKQRAVAQLESLMLIEDRQPTTPQNH